jgi:hypothetical protein
MCPTIPLGFDEINDFLFIYLLFILLSGSTPSPLSAVKVQ